MSTGRPTPAYLERVTMPAPEPSTLEEAMVVVRELVTTCAAMASHIDALIEDRRGTNKRLTAFETDTRREIDLLHALLAGKGTP